MLNVTLRGVTKLQKDLKAERTRAKKALSTAVKVEGYRLRKVMKAEIRKGAPGGRPFKGLSMIRRIMWGPESGRLKVNRPLKRLAIAIRYYIKRQDPIEMHVGFSGPLLSKSWKRLAYMHQEGFSTSADAY